MTTDFTNNTDREPAKNRVVFNAKTPRRQPARALIKRRGREGFRKGRKENLPPRSSAPTSASSALKSFAQFKTTDYADDTDKNAGMTGTWMTGRSGSDSSAYSCHQLSCRISVFCFPISTLYWMISDFCFLLSTFL